MFDEHDYFKNYIFYGHGDGSVNNFRLIKNGLQLSVFLIVHIALRHFFWALKANSLSVP